MGSKHCFRMRCLALLLKAEGLSCLEVGERTGMEQHTVRKWLKRYGEEGVKGLETRPGRGRKPIAVFQIKTDFSRVEAEQV